MKKANYTMGRAAIPADVLSDPELKLLGIPCLTILCKRGVDTADKIRHFVHDNLATITSTYKMKGTEEAVTILREAVATKTRIVVYRDYDCDGICAGAIAVQCLRALGVKAEQYANDRGIDGFGMCPAGIDHIMTKWPDTKIILTVDNGINAFEGAERVKTYHGVKLIVTDHHEQGEQLPCADAIVDPKQQGEFYAFKQLCGAGVIFKLMLALYIALKKNIKPVVDMIDIVALATVADVVPLIGENHTLVREGIEKIRSGERVFFRVMLEKLEIKALKASSALAFKLAPVVNAVSRMEEDTDIVVEMMLSDDVEFVSRGADGIIEINEMRKSLTNDQYEWFKTETEKTLAANPKTTSLVLRNDRTPEGIVGIIAGRLKEEYGRPSIVFSYNSGNRLLKGSARCGANLHMKDTLDKLPRGILESYGGHAKAAGLSLKPENYERFVREFQKLTDRLMNGVPTAEPREIDLSVSEYDCSEALCHQLDMLEPYGEGFPPPLLGMTAAPTEATYMGANQTHLKYNLPSGVSAVLWNEAEWQRERERRGKGFPKKFVGVPTLNAFRGNISVQFIAEYAN